MPLMVVLEVSDAAVQGGRTSTDAAAPLMHRLADDLVSTIPRLEDGASVRVELADGLIRGVATYVAGDHEN